MRSQPSVPYALCFAADQIDRYALGVDTYTRTRVLKPVAALMRQVANNFNGYLVQGFKDALSVRNLLETAKPYLDTDLAIEVDHTVLRLKECNLGTPLDQIDAVFIELDELLIQVQTWMEQEHPDNSLVEQMNKFQIERAMRDTAQIERAPEPSHIKEDKQ